MIYYNSSGGVDNIVYSYNRSQAESDPAGNTFAVSTAYSDLCKFDTSGNFFFDNYVGGPAASLAVAGVDGGPVTAPSDYYSFSLAANQSATIALTDLSGGQANLDLEDGSGDVLATGTVTNTNVDEVISNFVCAHGWNLLYPRQWQRRAV